jgi:hypothetical protein
MMSLDWTDGHGERTYQRGPRSQGEASCIGGGEAAVTASTVAAH